MQPRLCIVCGEPLNRKGLSRPNAACICGPCVRAAMPADELERRLNPLDELSRMSQEFDPEGYR
jgi:recombinational DNA repair protein (RecF pathway)